MDIIERFDLGSQIRRYRKRAGMSQKDLAFQLSISPTRLYNWESNRNEPSIDYLKDICEALNITPDDLLDTYLDNEKYTQKEHTIIASYRNKVDFQKAIDALLDVEECEL